MRILCCEYHYLAEYDSFNEKVLSIYDKLETGYFSRYNSKGRYQNGKFYIIYTEKTDVNTGINYEAYCSLYSPVENVMKGVASWENSDYPEMYLYDIMTKE